MRLRVFILITSIFFLPCVHAQTVDQTLEFANWQYENANYEQAVSAYRRVLFFDSIEQYSSKTYYKLAQCYSASSESGKANYYYDLAYNSSTNDSLKHRVILDKSFLFILEGKPNYAMMELAGLDENISEDIQQERLFYKGLINFMNQNYTASHSSFAIALDTNNTDNQHKLDSLFLELEKVNKIKPKLAQYLSLAIPGLGQLYAGYPKEAANSFLISATFWGLYFYTLQQYTILDALLSVYPWFQRYYLGGFNKAGELAIQKKQNRSNRVLIQIVELFRTEKVNSRI